jgi:hypothetical protein
LLQTKHVRIGCISDYVEPMGTLLCCKQIPFCLATCFLLVPFLGSYSTLKMVVIRSFETTVHIRTALRYIPAVGNITTSVRSSNPTNTDNVLNVSPFMSRPICYSPQICVQKAKSDTSHWINLFIIISHVSILISDDKPSRGHVFHYRCSYELIFVKRSELNIVLMTQ